MLAVRPLQAESIGYLANNVLNDNQRLSVHSVFCRAVNLSLTQRGLLTLLNTEYQNLPCAIRVTLPEHWDWRQHLAIGDTVVITERCLVSRTWQLKTQFANCWQPLPLILTDNASDYRLIRQYQQILTLCLADYCQRHQVDSALQLLPDWPYANRRLPELTLQADAQQIQQQILQLIGFGHGLTPDGDDYLLGYLAVLSLWQTQSLISEYLVQFKTSLLSVLDKTTDISKNYLFQAVQGDYSQPVHQLLACICAGADQQSLIAASYQVMQFGAASGVDCLAGMIHGLRTITALQ